MCSLLLLLTISSQLAASTASTASIASTFLLCLPSLLLSYGCSLTETIPRKFPWFGECTFVGPEKDRYSLKIPKWQHKLIRECKRRKLAFYFLNNVAKTCLYGLKPKRTLKSSMSLSLNHFLITVTFSTQVTSAPLSIL